MKSGFGRSLLRGLPIVISVVVVIGAVLFLSRNLDSNNGSQPPIRVLSYSGFVSSWGPGPEIAMRFLEETGLKVELHDGGDAGLLLKKLDLFPADVVIGFDQATLPEAAAARAWRDLGAKVRTSLAERAGRDESWTRSGFVAFDWAPMAFIYREGEIEPPRSLEDLADERFRGAIALQDPRTSTPGLQFLLWVLDEMGVEKGFEFLERLKPNVNSVAASWSAAYGLFTKKQAKLAFSYLTSPVYHWVEEKDASYRAAVFDSGHPVQIEFVGVPEGCEECSGAEKFVEFLLKPETQALIMRKNFMFPVVESARAGEFRRLPSVRTLNPERQIELMQRKDEIFARWRKLGL